nr:hypothetical protein [Tanacetum cinerariifolium]
MAITATIDRKVKVLITEASIRRHLKLEDSKGLSTLLTEEIFEQLALMWSNILIAHSLEMTQLESSSFACLDCSLQLFTLKMSFIERYTEPSIHKVINYPHHVQVSEHFREVSHEALEQASLQLSNTLGSRKKGRKRGKVFNWETAKYGKIWYDEDIYDLRSVETEFPAIAFNDEVSSEKTLSCEPTISYDDEDYTAGFGREDEDGIHCGRWVGGICDHAWRRLFGIRAPLVQEFILEFFSTCRIRNEMGLDMASTLCFQLGGVRCSMMCRQFILVLGLHTTKEMAEDGFGTHAKGRKSDARLSEGHFNGRLAHHFGLVSDDGLRRLSVVASSGPERQQVATAGAPEAVEDAHMYQFEDFSDSNDEFSSTDDDSFSIDNINYVEASPPYSELVSSEVMEIVILEVGGIDDDIILTIKDDIIREKLLNINLLIAKIKALNDNPTPSSNFMTKSSSTSLNSLLEETNTFDNSLPEFETFCFDVEEISSGSTTTHSDSSLYDSFIFDLLINPFPPTDRSDFYEFVDELIHIISLPEYDCFFFKIKPNSGDFTMDVVEDISLTIEPRVHNALPTHPNLQLNMEFKLCSEFLFTYVVWIFLPFLLYSVAPQYLLSLESEDTIFDPGICNYHFLGRMYLIGVEC